MAIDAADHNGYATVTGEERRIYEEVTRYAREMAERAMRQVKAQTNYDVRPTNLAPVILWNGQDIQAVEARRGWQRDFASAGRIINARWETASLKPTFAQAVRKKRCIVPASAYYEWRRDQNDKPLEKYAFRPIDGSWFCMAGLYEEVPIPDGTESRFLVLTRPMVKHVAIHDRTPVMLGDDAVRDWLNPSASEAAVQTALHAAARSWCCSCKRLRASWSSRFRQCPRSMTAPMTKGSRMLDADRRVRPARHVA